MTSSSSLSCFSSLRPSSLIDVAVPSSQRSEPLERLMAPLIILIRYTSELKWSLSKSPLYLHLHARVHVSHQLWAAANKSAWSWTKGSTCCVCIDDCRPEPRQHLDWSERSDGGRRLPVDGQDGPGQGCFGVFLLFRLCNSSRRNFIKNKVKEINSKTMWKSINQ